VAGLGVREEQARMCSGAIVVSLAHFGFAGSAGDRYLSILLEVSTK
jgi:hypothetical protein